MRSRLAPVRPLATVGLSLVLVVAAFAGCGGDDSGAAPADCTPVVGDAFTFVAQNIQWNTNCLKVKAGSTVTFTVELKDTGVKHDLQIFGQGVKDQTPLESGPKTQTLKFTFPTAGFYQFACTIHSNMEGNIYAE